MKVWRHLSEAREGSRPSVVTIGNFDGVHRGHQSVLDTVVSVANARGLASVVVTFDPHPAYVHRPQEAAPLLTGQKDKLELLQEQGIDATFVVPYNLEFAQHTPEAFIRTYIVEALHARTVVIGQDVRFGRGNSGDLTTLKSLGETYGFDVVVVDDFGFPDGGHRWSSSVVRQLVYGGEMGAVTQLLGRQHRMRGIVVHGDARGRDLGFPTANMSADSSGMVPADGVYAGWVTVVGGGEEFEHLPAAVSIGTNPTFDGQERRVEAYVIDRDGLDLYGKEIIVEFVDRLRPTIAFDNMESLVTQMHDDVARAREILN
ncbi:bifunctional riboflavin kinase/FAD synthetase [Jonesia quinghaiensis]|uniref:bifunctional riboflavin kinase/FAD synthetase n=1 Tax=Jonesia quinghaiensis TaxID=262806 RepID=UPI0003FB88F7|nr:bifunctional riboflavin kinase/FAD synthetase [Jonesia quinghaiensis]